MRQVGPARTPLTAEDRANVVYVPTGILPPIMAALGIRDQGLNRIFLWGGIAVAGVVAYYFMRKKR